MFWFRFTSHICISVPLLLFIILPTAALPNTTQLTSIVTPLWAIMDRQLWFCQCHSRYGCNWKHVHVVNTKQSRLATSIGTVLVCWNPSVSSSIFENFKSPSERVYQNSSLYQNTACKKLETCFYINQNDK